MTRLTLEELKKCVICGLSINPEEYRDDNPLCYTCRSDTIIDSFLGFWKTINDTSNLMNPIEISSNPLAFILGAIGTIIPNFANVKNLSNLIDVIVPKALNGHSSIDLAEMIQAGFRGQVGRRQLRDNLNLLSELDLIEGISGSTVNIDSNSIMRFFSRGFIIDHKEAAKLGIPSILTGIVWCGGISKLYENYLLNDIIQIDDGLIKIYVQTSRGLMIPRAVNASSICLIKTWNSAKENQMISEINMRSFLSSRISSVDYTKKIRSWIFGTGSAKGYSAKIWKSIDLEKGLAEFEPNLLRIRPLIRERGRDERNRIRKR